MGKQERNSALLDGFPSINRVQVRIYGPEPVKRGPDYDTAAVVLHLTPAAARQLALALDHLADLTEAGLIEDQESGHTVRVATK